MTSFQAQYQEVKYKYDMLQTFDTDGYITALDYALYAYSKNPTITTRETVEQKFAPISDYYTKLTEISSTLQKILDRATTSAHTASASLERYENKIHPEESTASREVMLGVLPNLRLQSIPYLLSASVFMALLAIFMMFQMGGVSAQLNLPPALLALWATSSSDTPFYKNPMVLGGCIVILLAIVIGYTILLYRKRYLPN